MDIDKKLGLQAQKTEELHRHLHAKLVLRLDFDVKVLCVNSQVLVNCQEHLTKVDGTKLTVKCGSLVKDNTGTTKPSFENEMEA